MSRENGVRESNKRDRKKWGPKETNTNPQQISLGDREKFNNIIYERGYAKQK